MDYTKRIIGRGTVHAWGRECGSFVLRKLTPVALKYGRLSDCFSFGSSGASILASTYSGLGIWNSQTVSTGGGTSLSISDFEQARRQLMGIGDSNV